MALHYQLSERQLKQYFKFKNLVIQSFIREYFDRLLFNGFLKYKNSKKRRCDTHWKALNPINTTCKGYILVLLSKIILKYSFDIVFKNDICMISYYSYVLIRQIYTNFFMPFFIEINKFF